MLTRIVSNTKFGVNIIADIQYCIHKLISTTESRISNLGETICDPPSKKQFFGTTEVKQDTEPPTGYKTKQYTSHLVLCHGARGPELWPRDIDMMTGLTSAITTMNRKELKDKKITVTACDIGSKSASNIDHSFDLLHFTPNSIKRITNFTHEKLNLLKLYLETGVADPELHTETLPQSHKYIFVCTHSARDERCGKCGPPVIKTIGTICKGRNDVTVAGTSHIGGHVWAANMIVYPRGQWYGRLDTNSADFERVIKSALNDEKPPEYHDRENNDDVVHIPNECDLKAPLQKTTIEARTICALAELHKQPHRDQQPSTDPEILRKSGLLLIGVKVLCAKYMHPSAIHLELKLCSSYFYK